MGQEDLIIYKIQIFEMIEKMYCIEIKDEEIEDIVLFEDLIKLIKNKTANEPTN